MEPSSRIRVKVCCIQDADEARLAIAGGAHALGLVSRMPSGPGVIGEDRIAEICQLVPPPVACFLLTALTHADGLVGQQRRTGANVIQLVSPVAPGLLRAVARALPGIALVPVVHVRGPESLDEAQELAAAGARCILLDSGNPGAAVPELGGTGRVHDWRLSRRIREALPVPLFLAGGLHSGNVAEAVRTVQPFGVDICSGLRREGRLQEDLLSEFMTTLAAIDT